MIMKVWSVQYGKNNLVEGRKRGKKKNDSKRASIWGTEKKLITSNKGRKHSLGVLQRKSKPVARK